MKFNCQSGGGGVCVWGPNEQAKHVQYGSEKGHDAKVNKYGLTGH